MSRIVFHSPSGEAELRGSERAHMASLVMDIGYAPLSRVSDVAYLFDGFGLYTDRRSDRDLLVILKHGDDIRVTIGDRSVNNFELALNTCMDLGNDTLRFLTRIHAQCEIHGWFAGKDRAFFANLIDYGLRWKMMRDIWGDEGWPAVRDFLRARSDEDVVMSYSVCDSFPNEHSAVRGGWRPAPVNDHNDEGLVFDELSFDEQWSFAMKGIADMQIKPETMQQGFSSGLTCFDVLAEHYRQLREKEAAKEASRKANSL